jgi:hypothetical protein
MIREDPVPRPSLFQLQEQRVCSCFEVFAFNLYVVRKRDGSAFVRPRTPRRTLSWAEALVKETIVNELAPDVSGPIIRRRVMHARTVIPDRNLDGPDPLRNL